MNYQEILKTKLQRGNPKWLIDKRIKRIEEAVNWEGSSSLDSQIKHKITKLPNGLEVYFLKSGKEKFKRNNPNPHDMRPCVGDEEKPYGFDEVWKQLSKISLFDFEIFKAVLTLVYRNAYMLDHVEEKEGMIRYKPSIKIVNCIQEFELSIGKYIEYGLFGLLHFMDILGWNEDVKYHVEDSNVTFEGNYGKNVGRVNTLKSCITVTYMTYEFVKEILNHSSEPQEINWSSVYDAMQRLMRSRGICPVKQKELLMWLHTYIIKEISNQKKL